MLWNAKPQTQLLTKFQPDDAGERGTEEIEDTEAALDVQRRNLH